MSVWRVRDWKEVEYLAKENNSCIAPGGQNYDAAKMGFSHRSMMYFGFDTPHTALYQEHLSYQGYARLAKLDGPVFMDYMTAVVCRDRESEILSGIAGNMAGEVSHLYFPLFCAAGSFRLKKKTWLKLPEDRTENLPPYYNWLRFILRREDCIDLL